LLQLWNFVVATLFDATHVVVTPVVSTLIDASHIATIPIVFTLVVATLNNVIENSLLRYEQLIYEKTIPAEEPYQFVVLTKTSVLL
jgi:hypothetical protein